MSGAGGSAEVFGEEGLADEGGVIGRVEAGDFGDESEVHSFLLTEGEVLFERLGVVLEILGAVELDGVYENGDGDGSLGTYFFSGGPDELEMPLMEGSHRGNQGEGTGRSLKRFPYRVDVWEAGDHLSECWVLPLNQP